MDGPDTSEEKFAGASYPGSASSAASVPKRGSLAFGDGEPLAREAEHVQASGALRTAWILAVPSCVLILISVGSLLGLLPLGRHVAELSEHWRTSLAVLVMLLVCAQSVSCLLAVELWAVDPRQGRDIRWTRLAAVSTLRLLVLAAGVLTFMVGTAWYFTAVYSWAVIVTITVTAELAVVLVSLWTFRLIRGSGTGETDRDGPGPSEPPAGPVPSQDPFLLLAPDEQQRTLRAVGASGGGIRAAAFVLGGYQSVQAHAPGLRVSGNGPEPHLFAVSGGSYTAAALALRRTFTATGERRQVASPWDTAYGMGSRELDRLRRHTRYLFEPARYTRDGIVSLLMGAALNLFILAVALRLLTWVTVQLSVSTGFVGIVKAPGPGAPITDLVMAPGWGLLEWGILLSVPLLCAVAIAALTFYGWLGSSALDDDGGASAGTAWKRTLRSAALRPTFFFGAVAWLAIFIGVPTAVVGVVHLTTSNAPTTVSSGILDDLGFSTRAMCQQSFVAGVLDAADEAENAARVSPGQQREVETGACGVSTKVVRSVDENGVPSSAAVSRTDVASAAGALFSHDRLAGQVTGVGAALTLVLALLRRGPSPEAAARAKWYVRARRALLTWVPLLVVAALATYAVLVWSFGFFTRVSGGYVVGALVLTFLAFLVAYTVDANSTSMHRFYRFRLSDAFAVGIDDQADVARELPEEVVYTFSAMGEVERPPRLHVVTTLNSQKPNETPTMRGGFPMVFGPETVDVHREEGRSLAVPADEYERFAGAGRVSIMATVAMSGAAISPLMGRYAVQMKPYRLLLTLFNLRVGTWVRNPLHLGRDNLTPTGWSRVLWMTSRPGLAQILAEAHGSASSADSRWLYLSDGGHLDNTGLVECVRHCAGHPGRILVLDASNDPPGTWSAVGDAIGVIRADLGIDLKRVPMRTAAGSKDVRMPWARRYDGGGLEILVVKAVRPEVPSDDEQGLQKPKGVKWLETLPPNVQSFLRVHPDFPRASTARQKFGDLEFEAYRGFGFASVTSALTEAGWS